MDEAMKRCIEQQEHKIILWGKEYRDRFEVAEAFGITGFAYGSIAVWIGQDTYRDYQPK